MTEVAGVDEVKPALRCPMCAEGDECDHDQDTIDGLYKATGQERVYVAGPYTSTDPAQVAASERRRRRAVYVADTDLHTLLQLPAFRRFVFSLLERNAVMALIFDPDDREIGHVERMIFRDGGRNVSKQILDQCDRVSPELTAKLLREKGYKNA